MTVKIFFINCNVWQETSNDCPEKLNTSHKEKSKPKESLYLDRTNHRYVDFGIQKSCTFFNTLNRYDAQSKVNFHNYHVGLKVWLKIFLTIFIFPRTKLLKKRPLIKTEALYRSWQAIFFILK